MVLAVALAVAGAALVLAAASQPWAHAVVAEGALGARVAPTGRELAPAVAALGLVGLAGAVLVVATRRSGRLLAGVLLLLAGLGVVATILLTATRLPEAVRPAAGKAVGQREARPARVSGTAWPAVAGVGGAAVAAAGAFTAARGRGWPTMSRRYEAPGPRAPEPGDRGMWEAMDRGEDPTR